ncbi:HAD domain-containing protein [Gottfriedia acidiceleris]|uniref:HAD domain-containing protein n=1 Tax=Gottfriedia acidiceleris TaxID=371036 RepID=UPI002F2664CE
MKIIFLDIDGVLNTDRQIRLNNLEQIDNIKFDPIAMKNLKIIVDESKANIVITSTWRVHRQDNGYLWREIIRNFEMYNLDTNILLDITPVIDTNMKTELKY